MSAPHVRFHAAVPLPPGWYQVRVAARSADRFPVRKRLELTADPADGNPRPVAREAFAWNQGFQEAFMLRLTRPAAGVRVDVWHAEGTLALDGFSVRPVSRPAALARAVREKVRLVRAYRCFGSAARRGAKLLLAGRVREFGAKLLGGLTDTRVMQLGAVRAEEADGAWWRRHALPADEADRVRRAVAELADPMPVAVLLPVDPGRLDAARLSAQSVRRQLYPHWQLLVAVAGPGVAARELAGAIGPDPRVVVERAPLSAGPGAAVAKAMTHAGCDRVVVLPPGVELAEHALFHLAGAAAGAPAPDAVGGRAADGPAAVWMVPARRLGDAGPADLGAEALADWAVGGTPADRRAVLPPVLAYPIDDRPLLDRARVGKAPVVPGRTLFLGVNLRGIGGYDHLAFALLKGLPSVGAELRLRQGVGVRADLIPPALLPPPARRRPGDPQLVMGPPFALKGFGLDRASAVLTMWETDTIDPGWVATLNRAGLVIVPSHWQVDCFRRCGVTAPLAVAPLGFDPLVYHPAGEFPGVCTFGTAGALTSGGLRKNAQWVVDLFRRAFPTEPDVRLRVKITPGSPGVETYDDPRVDVIRAVLPNRELADWYRSLTAYVNASSGEGFGLHLIEAMACGRPLVTAPHSGLTMFFDPAVGYPVGYKLVPVRNEVYTGNWAEPDEASMAAQLRRVFADPAGAGRLGAAAAARAKSFTWRAAGQALAKALRDHGFLS